MPESTGTPLSPVIIPTAKTQADQGWDTYQERVLRNEGRLEGLEQLVKETRAADAKLVEMRSGALAKELADTAQSLQHLMSEQRSADKEEFQAELAALKELLIENLNINERRRVENMASLREIYDTALANNMNQSHAQIEASDDRATASVHHIEVQVQAWRTSDREARELQAVEYQRRLETLNHAHQKQIEFQAASVTRELWDAEHRAIGEKINVVERSILTMPTNITYDKTIESMNLRIEQITSNLAATADARFAVMQEKVQDLKEAQLRQAGQKQGYAAVYGWAVAMVGLIISVIVAANAIFGK